MTEEEGIPLDSSHFSTLINDFKPGIFGSLNMKKEELLEEVYEEDTSGR